MSRFPRPRPTTRAMVAGASAVIVVLFTGLVVADRSPPLPGDLALTAVVTQWAQATGLGVSFWSAVTWFGAGPVLSVVGAAGAGALAWYRRRLDAAAALAAMITVFACWALLRVTVSRPRPAGGLVATDTAVGFPSGHATNAAACAALTVLLLVPLLRRRRAVLVAAVVVFAGAVGVSRVVLGVHYPSDVLAGWALAAAVVGARLALIRAGLDPRTRPRTQRVPRPRE